MSAGAVFKFHGRFNSLNEIKAHIHAGAEYPPQIGDSAQYVEADGSLAEASFTSAGWIERSRFSPDGSTSFAGPVQAPGLQLTASSQRAEVDLSEPFRAQTLLAIGSSTTEHCSKTTGIMAGTAGFFELDDGPLAWGKSRYGLPLDLVYNGAVGGTSSEQIFASRVAMLAAGAAHPGAWCWF